MTVDLEVGGGVRTDIIINEIRKHVPGGRVLNIGDVKDGKMTERLKDHGYEVTTIDVSKKADVTMDIDNKSFPARFKGKFNCVVAGEIIEHVVYTDKFLSEIHKSLKSNGILILSFPNINCLKNRVRVLIGMFPAYGASNLVDDPTNEGDKFHVRDFNLSKVTEFLHSHNFEILTKKTNGIYVRSWHLLPRNICPITFGNSIIITARKS